MGSNKSPAATHAAIAAAPVLRNRAVLFLVVLLLVTAAFAFFVILVKTTPSFPLDLHITRDLQSIIIPGFAGLMGRNGMTTTASQSLYWGR
jgi:hypothetical protein